MVSSLAIISQGITIPVLFKERLAAKNIDVEFKENKNGIYGVSFRYENVAMKGSEIGYKWAVLEKAFIQNQQLQAGEKIATIPQAPLIKLKEIKESEVPEATTGNKVRAATTAADTLYIRTKLKEASVLPDCSYQKAMQYIKAAGIQLLATPIPGKESYLLAFQYKDAKISSSDEYRLDADGAYILKNLNASVAADEKRKPVVGQEGSNKGNERKSPSLTTSEKETEQDKVKTFVKVVADEHYKSYCQNNPKTKYSEYLQALDSGSVTNYIQQNEQLSKEFLQFSESGRQQTENKLGIYVQNKKAQLSHQIASKNFYDHFRKQIHTEYNALYESYKADASIVVSKSLPDFYYNHINKEVLWQNVIKEPQTQRLLQAINVGNHKAFTENKMKEVFANYLKYQGVYAYSLQRTTAAIEQIKPNVDQLFRAVYQALQIDFAKNGMSEKEIFNTFSSPDLLKMYLLNQPNIQLYIQAAQQKLPEPEKQSIAKYIENSAFHFAQNKFDNYQLKQQEDERRNIADIKRAIHDAGKTFDKLRTEQQAKQSNTIGKSNDINKAQDLGSEEPKRSQQRSRGI